MADEVLHLFLLLEVPAKKSGNIVEYLFPQPERPRSPVVREAAAVYSATDVITRLDGPPSEVSNVLIDIVRQPQVLSTAAYLISEFCRAEQATERGASDEKEVVAFSFVEARPSASRPLRAIAWETTRIRGVSYVAVVENRGLLIARIVARDKAAFDTFVMDTKPGFGIQADPAVSSTRTFITNSRFHREASQQRLSS
ncbi:MAG: hypothetical protein JSV79_01105 [Armatimonadota bacterium]|nr:MAG: hypothetical protein JSV79_01105 [Armatimonadota bacterium]